MLRFWVCWIGLGLAFTGCSKDEAPKKPSDPKQVVEILMKVDQFKAEGDLTKDQFDQAELKLHPASCKSFHSMPDEMTVGLQVEETYRMSQPTLQMRTRMRIVEKTPTRLVMGRTPLESRFVSPQFQNVPLTLFAPVEVMQTCENLGPDQFWKCDEPSFKASPELANFLISHPETAEGYSCSYTDEKDAHRIESFQKGTYATVDGTVVPALIHRTEVAAKEECKNRKKEIVSQSTGTRFQVQVHAAGFFNFRFPAVSCATSVISTAQVYVSSDNQIREPGTKELVGRPIVVP